MSNILFTIIHTDGGCSPNPGEGAYVAILQNGERLACVRGYVPFATNQQMEQAAAIAGLHALKSARIPVKLATDSQYVHGGASKWINTWRRNGWKNSEGKPLANIELWKALDDVMAKYVINWTKVEGHAGVKMNMLADALVQDTRQAKGNPDLYRMTEIPEIACPWNFETTQNQISKAVEDELAYLRARMANLLLKGKSNV